MCHVFSHSVVMVFLTFAQRVAATHVDHIASSFDCAQPFWVSEVAPN